MTACMIGWSHSRFCRASEQSVEDLVVEAAIGAMADARVDPADIDAVYLGHFNGGFSAQDFTASLVLQAAPGLRFKPASRVENACATGTAAVHAGLHAIAAGKARRVLCVGVEKMSETSPAALNRILLRCAYRPEAVDERAGFAGIFGAIAAAYFERHGDQSEALAAIAVKNHANGARNPFAQLRKPLDLAFCREPSERNPYVAGPLKRTDCALVSDGAAALVLADQDTARTAAKAVAFRGTAQVNDLLPLRRRDLIAFEGCTVAWQKALEEAGLDLFDLDLVETHDCFTIAELLACEAMGLAPRGRGGRVVLDGWTAQDGRLPVNLSGGLKSKGHPIGATGVSMHVMCAMQLMGEAGAMQRAGATLAGLYNMGGACVASYVSILERQR